MDLKWTRICLEIHLVSAESSIRNCMEIFLDSVSVINMNFDTLTRVNYSRQSQLCDAAVGVNRAQQPRQQQPLRRAIKSLRRSKQSSRTY